MRVWASFRVEEGGLGGACSSRKTKGRERNGKKATERHVHSLLVTMCEIRCVTESANGTHTTQSQLFFFSFNGNVAPDQDQ